MDHFDYLTALLEMSFHGFGGGSARFNELRHPSMFHCLFTNGTVYYTLLSLKGFNSTSRRTRKEIERKLPPIISHYFLLFRSLIRTKASMPKKPSESHIPNQDKSFRHSTITYHPRHFFLIGDSGYDSGSALLGWRFQLCHWWPSPTQPLFVFKFHGSRKNGSFFIDTRNHIFQSASGF